MLLKDILVGMEFNANKDIAGIVPSGVTDDSRAVSAGGMFIAVKGPEQDGSDYIKDAISKGAKVVVAQSQFDSPAGVCKIIVKDSRTCLTRIAANYYGHPSSDLKVTGVTGTNGKTTVTYVMESILKCAGCKTGVIGTINYRIGDKIIPAKNTTPGAFDLQSMLAGMLSQGVKHAVMEVSSHSLDQGRIDGVKFDLGIFTNLASDHLDYHKTRENYFLAKAKLFDHIKDGGFAILNSDDAKVASLAGSIRAKIIKYGLKERAGFSASGVKLSMDGSEFTVSTPLGALRISTGLIGLHNVSNVLACVAASHALGIDDRSIIGGARSISCVPGRLEPISCGQDFNVFVDYAHTEDALANVLALLKDIAKRDIITVFGCGGDRDRTKRPLMGMTACRSSSRVIITSDNPRSEEPMAIISEIEKGLSDNFANYEILPDRREAIEKALKAASKGDIVLIAGKGHEDYQIIGDKKYHFDDRETAREILKKL